MGQSHQQASHMDRVNAIGTRASTLLDQAGTAMAEQSHPNARKAHLAVHHAIGHVHDAYGLQCMTDKDRDHYLGLAEICLDHAEKLLK